MTQDTATPPAIEPLGLALRLPFVLRHPNARAPVFATSGAGCFDLFSPVDGIVPRLGAFEVDIGVAFEVPPAHTMLIFGRSGHGIKSAIRLANCTGVIDSDYRGTVKVKLTSDNKDHDFFFKAGDRIAQGMLVPTPLVYLDEVAELSETDRGEGGLGSTGA